VLGEVVEATETLRAQGKVRFWGLTGVGVPESLHRVVDSGALCSVQTVYNLINASAGADVDPGFDMPDFKRIIDKSNAAGMGVIVIRVLAAGALSGVAERDPVAVPTVAPIGSGRDYQQDFDRSEGFRFLVNEGFADDLVEASVRFALSNKGVSTVLVGYSNLDHLEQSVQFAEKGPLPSAALDRLPQMWAQFVE
ncbi:MAG: aldo/keto reductase, partial [Dehalococcoidia bacterium]|nr:aldo/keto reductase [Dehalococcoidia bacterium]